MLLTASVCLSICPSVCLPIYLYVCKSIQARLSVSPLLYSSDSVYLYVRLSADCLSICLAVNRSRLMLRSVGLSFRPSACLSVCLAVANAAVRLSCLSVRISPPTYLSVCISVRQSAYLSDCPCYLPRGHTAQSESRCRVSPSDDEYFHKWESYSMIQLALRDLEQPSVERCRRMHNRLVTRVQPIQRSFDLLYSG